MAITKEQKASIVKKFGANEKDTGDIKVQIALLTEKINQLTEHCKVNKKDAGSRRGLLGMVGHRRSLLKYYQRTDIEGYRAILKELNLRK
ncbi:30S ribosomal protein S15 [Treponema pedis]|uniref:Small ribosomal subunit protein uS15 n=2 Tax=Treponema pedis TaxID=409322 RepID=S5ZLJ9_9SPIR|nr:30S ribosomal protein S15 [Treponema pedis]AGT43457.1 30S ribosomal protein S15 [Treponema pedis str. T A4]QOW60992.1 30S ribosomal protein S15 [Treponema pedis]QSI04265.1 30S ribosomal protein S15 [Treponema pedis]